MNKLIVAVIASVAVVVSVSALYVARDNHRLATKVSQPDNPVMPPSVPAPTQESTMNQNQSKSSSVSNTSVTTNSLTSQSNGSSSQSSQVALTIASDGSSHNQLSFNRGANVTLTLTVTGGGSLRFHATGGQHDSGLISSGQSDAWSFTADQSFTIQPQADNGSNRGSAIVVNVN